MNKRLIRFTRNRWQALGPLVLALALAACTPPPEAIPGARSGQLPECPPRPNCVSSQAPDEAHRVAPIPLKTAPQEAVARMRAILESLDGVRVTVAKGHYLRAEFTSRVFRFVDDVEFLADGEANRMHVRSASRIGYGDLGVNRRRVDDLRKRFEDAGSRSTP